MVGSSSMTTMAAFMSGEMVSVIAGCSGRDPENGWAILGFGRQSNGQNGAGGSADNPLCSTAENEVIESGSAVSAEYDQGGACFLSLANDLIIGNTGNNACLVIRKIFHLLPA